jgi:hypothetical protein
LRVFLCENVFDPTGASGALFESSCFKLKMKPRRKLLICICMLLTACCAARASVGLLMEEPFGTFGYVNPTGHAAIYLSNVCAASPTVLRRCGPNEAGVVISRYHHVGGYDWLAMPLIPYLYAVDTIGQIPDTVTPRQEADLRDAYRREHLEALAPDGPDGAMPDGEWIQLVGASYDRRIYVFQLDAPVEKDDELIAEFNDRKNQSHFNLFFNNCADLSRQILNFYYPHSVHRNIIADVGLTTPKQVARSMVQYAKKHERLEYHAYVLPQVAGTVPRSKPIDGVIESFLKKKYVLPVVIFQPAVAGGLTAAYFLRGRYKPGADAETLSVADLRKLYTNDVPLAPRTLLNTASAGHVSGFEQPALSTFGESTEMYRSAAMASTADAAEAQ